MAAMLRQASTPLTSSRGRKPKRRISRAAANFIEMAPAAAAHDSSPD